MLLPRARRDKLTVRELSEETLIYDRITAKAHCLNRASALVWKHCDGQTTPAELAVMLQRELGVPANEALVRLALEQLGRRRLLEAPTLETGESRQSRRKVLRQLGIALAALPAIMSVTAPWPLQAASAQAACPPGQTLCASGCKNLLTDNNNCGSCGNVCPTAFQCQNGKCVSICFPAGTLVTTPAGYRPIESIQTGDRVWGFNLAQREWLIQPVTHTSHYVFEGDLQAITVLGQVIEATPNHPFWVLQGEELDRRRRTEPLAGTPQASPLPGSWVDAGDLQIGDLLLFKSGNQAAVDQLATRPVRQPVYNFLVETVHTYAVGPSQILVHNGC